jgi:hypothetical protein
MSRGIGKKSGAGFVSFTLSLGIMVDIFLIIMKKRPWLLIAKASFLFDL